MNYTISKHDYDYTKRKGRELGLAKVNRGWSGYENFNSKNAEDIFRILLKNKGFLPFNDKSAPGIIYKEFGISKKAFKRAIGELYKDRKISIEKGGIRVVK